MKKLHSMLLLLVCCLSLNIFNAAQSQTTPQIAKGNCDACAESCEKTLNYCVETKGQHAQVSTTNTIKDCMAVCKMTSSLLERSSVLQKKAIALCIDACNNCIKSCDSFKSDNNMKACANECRKCVGNCQKLSVTK